MPEQSDELKKRLQDRANEAIEKLLAPKGRRRDLSMDEMEDLVGEFGLEIRQSLMQEMATDAKETSWGLCETYGGKLRYKGKSPNGWSRCGAK